MATANGELLPFEVMLQVLSWTHPRHVQRYARLSKLYQQQLKTRCFACMNLRRFLVAPPVKGSQLISAEERKVCRAPTELDTVFTAWPSNFQTIYVQFRLQAFDHILWRKAHFLKCQIPKAFAHLQNLRSLDLSFCSLRGVIPDLSTMQVLEELRLEKNFLSGTIPTTLKHLRHLKVLDLSGNRFVGSIPRMLCVHLACLECLDLSNNCLTGVIPREIGSLQQLRRLHLKGNMLEGHIPGEIGSLMNLEILQLGDNHLRGQIPRTFTTLHHLEEVGLTGNYVNLFLPHEILRGSQVWRILMANRLPNMVSLAICSVMAAVYLDCFLDAAFRAVSLHLRLH
ncbi:hypothetical protein HDU81_009022 [Chytriomyces hyalinus]|nr:hypothetical protein HDU81_009022 [Chytriomyces hyalinus]